MEASVSDLKTFDPGLQRGDFRCRPHVANWRSVAQTGHPDVDQIVGQKTGIQLYKTPKGVSDQLVVGPTELSVCSRHVIGNVDYYGTNIAEI
jgi:hypothetical protein